MLRTWVKEHRDILGMTSLQLFGVTLIYAVLVVFGVLQPLVRVEWLALLIGLFAVLAYQEGPHKPHISVFYLWIGGLLLIVSRCFSYLFSPVPPGYDPGWYKFVFEHPFSERWTYGVFEGLFTWVFGGLGRIVDGHWLVVGSLFVLSIGVGVTLYFVLRRWFGSDVAVLAFLLYSCSFAMYKVFWFAYIKNLLGMGLLVLALYLITQDDYRWWAVLVAGVLGGFHRPAFFLFGLTYIVYLFFTDDKQQRVFDGVLMVVLALLFNIDRLPELIGPVLFAPLAEPGSSGGTFFEAFTYWKFSFLYVPFALLGCRVAWQRAKPLVIGAAICGAIVLLELFFYNRFIIYFDLLLIILAAVGMYALLSRYLIVGRVIVISVLVVTGLFLLMQLPYESPLISPSEFSQIRALSLDGPLLITDKTYSTWFKGYYHGVIVAPGLFDNDPWNYSTWVSFWSNASVRPSLLHSINVSYVHVGDRQVQYLASDACFSLIEPHVYRLIC